MSDEYSRQYPEVWTCIECRRERTYGTQVRPFPPFHLEAIHKEGASLMCAGCQRATRHVFAGGTTAERSEVGERLTR